MRAGRVVWTSVVVLAIATASPLYAQRAELAIIVNPAVNIDSLDLATTRRIFLARQQNWPDGARAHPVNLPASSPLRSFFSQRVLERSARSLAAYWNDLYFHGTQPPPVLESERAVILYVQRTPGAIGYVSVAAADTAADVRVILKLQ